MARKNDPAQQPDGGMPLDENRMMQAAQLAAMMAQGMQQTRSSTACNICRLTCPF